MIRLIIEGEKGKAEDTFWHTLLTSLTTNPFKIYTTHGNKSAEAVVRMICNEAQRSDIVILGLDKYTWATYKTCEKLLQLKAHEVGFDLMQLAASSFEGIFISYIYLPDLIRVKVKELLPILSEVSQLLNTKRSISGKLALYDASLKKAGLSPDVRTQERFVSWLLTQVTQQPRARRITKSEIGDCWLISCCDAHYNNRAACVDIGSLSKSYPDKMRHLEANSIMKSNTYPLAYLVAKDS